MAVNLAGALFRVSLVIVALSVQRIARSPLLPLPCNLAAEQAVEEKLPLVKGHVDELQLEPNTLLRSAKRLFEGHINGSETVAVLGDSGLVLLDKFGYLHQALASSGGEYQLDGTAMYLGAGRPLGGHVTPDGDILVCDSVKGLIQVTPSTGRISILSNEVSRDSQLAPSTRIGYANDLDVASDGTVYFSDSSAITPALNRDGFWDTMRAFVLTGLQGSPTGRLLKFDPKTHRTECLVEGIWYANGVALSADETYVLVVETWSFRVLRFWLQGPKAGQLEVFIAGIPGYPDGISRSADGNFWIAVAAPALPIMQAALPNKWARWALAWISESIYRPKPEKHGLVIKVNQSGKVMYSLQDPGGEVIPMVTSVTEHGSKLFFGNLAYPFVGMLDLSSVSLPERTDSGPRTADQ